MSDDFDALLDRTDTPEQEAVGKLIRYIALATWRADGWLDDDFDDHGLTHRWGAQEFVVRGMTAPVREALARAVTDYDTALDVIGWLYHGWIASPERQAWERPNFIDEAPGFQYEPLTDVQAAVLAAAETRHNTSGQQEASS